MGTEAKELLTKAKELLRNEVTQITYATWIRDLDIEGIHDDTIVLRANSDIQMDTINHRYKELIINTFAELTKKYYQLHCICDSEKTGNEKKSPVANYNFISSNHASINPNYTFETFVVGKNNSFAHAASLAVSEAPAKAYNPLYLYGGVGLGKTHLMHAIANSIFKSEPSKSVLYVTSETFTNEVINAIRDAKTQLFRDKYRNIDILLIDDIQFIAGKDAVQEEFFHTFNTLRESKKQIILSSDKAPKDIEFLEERLKSRFEWGLIADLSSPDYETRLAILRKKSSAENLFIEDDYLIEIATRIDSNIRELEGVLNKVIAFSTLIPGPISKESVEKAINDIVKKQEKILSTQLIQETVCKYFNIDIKDIKSSNRANEITYPRQIAMYLCYDVAHQSFPSIGREFGKRDHTTVMHAYRKIKKEIKDIPNTKLIVDSLTHILLGD